LSPRAADAIIVGSGPGATSAAYPIVQSGASVLMLDVGNDETRYKDLIPPASFLDIRKTDPRQHRYLIGDDFEGVPFGTVRVGAQLTPPRQYIARDTDRLTPLSSSSFFATESLALGGLGRGWGASSVMFDDRDLEGFPISATDLAPHYEAVAARIGISGERDDLLPYFGQISSLQPPMEADSCARLVLSRYTAGRARFNERGLYLGQPRLAVLTRDLGDRRAQQYREMEFYADTDRSVFRPSFSVEELRSSPRFTYATPYLVESFVENNDGAGVEVAAAHARTGEQVRFQARRLVLAAGTMGTARIVLRSFGLYDTPVPLVANAHIYVPCLNLAMLGQPMQERRHSLTQVGFIYDPDRDCRHLVYGEIHGYRSLLLFKLAKESFLPVPEGMRIVRELMSALLILVIEHDDDPSPDKRCLLRRGPAGEPDRLEVSYARDPAQVLRERRAEKEIRKLFRKLGCLPVGRVDAGPGSSIHYGGPLPMTSQERPLTATPSCRLRGTRTVYLADGSSFPYLPAKPLTFTLMANADRVGGIVARDLR